jgi:diphosphomevalonate decarboxylase
MDDTKVKQQIKVVAPINIALVKYWGKRNDELMLPLNDSISVTIDALYAETCVRIVDDDTTTNAQDEVVINGKVCFVCAYVLCSFVLFCF